METIRDKTKQLCADFDTIRAEKKVWVDNRDTGIVHESTGAYVTESTAGYFPNRTVPAYKMCTLFVELLDLYETKDKKAVALVEKKFGEALWEGFQDPTDKTSREKKKIFRALRKDVKPADYNNLVADIYDAAMGLTKTAQEKKDKAGEQLFGSIMNLAAVASDADSDPYFFDNAFQLKALEFVEKAIQLNFCLK